MRTFIDFHSSFILVTMHPHTYTHVHKHHKFRSRDRDNYSKATYMFRKEGDNAKHKHS